MVPKICSVDGCDARHNALGYCRKHYNRVQRTGDPGPAGARRKLWLEECAVSDCSNIVGQKGARGWCTKHYQMFLKAGDPTGSTAPPEAQRFWRRVRKTESCWLWIGGGDQLGYGHFGVDGKTQKAHRWAYEDHFGPIPEGLVLDHLCRTPSCVNPLHLEPVTNQENLDRGWGRRIKNGWVDHCINGHQFTPDNTYVSPKGTSVCRTCSAVSRRKYERKMAA